MPDAPVIFDEVEVVKLGAFGMTCRIDGFDYEIGSEVPLRGTLIAVKGDVGRLVLPGGSRNK